MLAQINELALFFPGLLAAGIGVFLLSAVLMQGSIRAFSIRRPTIPAIFYLTYIFMIFLPAFLVYLDNPGPYRDSYIIGVISVMITVPLGVIITNQIFGYHYAETERYFSKPPQEPESFRGMYLTHLLIVPLLVLILVDYVYHAPVIPILELIRKTSDPMGLTLAREEAFKLMDPRWGMPQSTPLFYAYLFLRTLLFPLTIMTTLGYALYSKKPNWFVLFLVVFACGGFYAVSSLARAPISAIFMRVFFFLYLFYQGRVSKKLVGVFFALMLAFPLIVTTFANATDRTLWDGLVAVGKRLSYAPALDLYYYFEMFPTAHDFLHGHTLVKPILQLLGKPYFYIENFAAMYISPWGVKSAHANAAFISNLHADFGFYGVTLGGFFCGAAMQGVHIFLARSQKTILNMAVYSFMIYAIWVLNFGSVTSVLFVNGVIPVAITVGLMRLMAYLITKGVKAVNSGKVEAYG